MKRILFCMLLLATISVSAQTKVKLKDVGRVLNKVIQIEGTTYFEKSVNKVFAIIKVMDGFDTTHVTVYLKFNVATALAHTINKEFGHFTGIVNMVNNQPVLIVSKSKNAVCYKFENEGPRSKRRL
jgi:hypothetical protein